MEMLQKDLPADGPAPEHLRVVREQAAHLHSLVVNVLDFASLTRDALEVRTERGSVKEVLAEYYAERRPGVTSRLREFVFSTATDLPYALFDRARLVQIVDTLVENALKFTDAGTRIHLRVEPDRSGDREVVRIDVEDGGPGIPEDRLPHIFESFRQGDGSSTRERGGMGLGLALARTLAEKMGGQLDVQSQIGRGTVFSLKLPAA
jgi:signal transduction histidine kinase